MGDFGHALCRLQARLGTHQGFAQPQVDEYYTASIQNSIEETKKFKLIRRDVSFDGWLEPKYLNNALKELKLEDYWPQQDAAGKIKVPGRNPA